MDDESADSIVLRCFLRDTVTVDLNFILPQRGKKGDESARTEGKACRESASAGGVNTRNEARERLPRTAAGRHGRGRRCTQPATHLGEERAHLEQSVQLRWAFWALKAGAARGGGAVSWRAWRLRRACAISCQ